MGNWVFDFLKEQLSIGGRPSLEDSKIADGNYDQIDAWERLKIRICTYRIIAFAVLLGGALWAAQKFTTLPIDILDESQFTLLEYLLVLGLGMILGKGFFGGKDNDS